MVAKKLTAEELNDLLPYAFGDELDYIRMLGHKVTPGGVAVMLGVGPGVMALALLEGAQAEFLLVGVDTDNFTALPHLEQAGYGGFMTPIESLSWKAADRFVDGTINLVIVDACHEYKCVKRDIVAWLPKVRKGGIIFFHDYIVQENDLPKNGVRKAVEKFRNQLGIEIARPGCSIVFKKV